VGVPAVHGLAADDDLAAAGAHRAGEDLDQRRLAGSVVSQEAHHLAAIDVHADATDREHPAIGFLDIAKLDQPLAHGLPLSEGGEAV
jgi:hypothetical protein